MSGLSGILSIRQWQLARTLTFAWWQIGPKPVGATGFDRVCSTSVNWGGISMLENKAEEKTLKPYVTRLGAFALAVGTAIGWGSLVVTNSNYLLNAGPVGSVIGMIIGAAIMLISWISVLTVCIWLMPSCSAIL